MKEGYIHIYTGNGKGKTTAAFGLAVRALCSGKNVFIGQFVKSMKYNETAIESVFTGKNDPTFGKVQILQFGRGCFITREPEQEDISCAHDGLEKCAAEIDSGKWDVVILDEICIAIHCGLLTAEEVAGMLNRRKEFPEIILTGRYAPELLIGMADLVTEMKEIRHYYTRGILSRNGIDR